MLILDSDEFHFDTFWSEFDHPWRVPMRLQTAADCWTEFDDVEVPACPRCCCMGFPCRGCFGSRSWRISRASVAIAPDFRGFGGTDAALAKRVGLSVGGRRCRAAGCLENHSTRRDRRTFHGRLCGPGFCPRYRLAARPHGQFCEAGHHGFLWWFLPRSLKNPCRTDRLRVSCHEMLLET